MTEVYIRQGKVAARYKRIAEMTLAGKSSAQIAVELGICPRTVRRAQLKTDTASGDSVPPYSEEETRTARQLLMDGASFSEVARTLGRDSSYLSKKFPGMSVWTKYDGAKGRKFYDQLKRLRCV